MRADADVGREHGPGREREALAEAKVEIGHFSIVRLFQVAVILGQPQE
jgi:hypothetical protein